ncbi:unnamed protein product [Cylicocyclus nassatus]|uniref:Transthyretin-like family protein n=1 Tax=Cylicocyclus nassatus TaxID=53992 RepID=A0AA36DUV2_CYLNA|nr:unnamed protein product [Cylicocyclus nassatus]
MLQKNANADPLKPTAGVRIVLLEKKPSFRKVAQDITNPKGFYKISGNVRDINQTQLHIYHRCNYKGICYQMLSIPTYRISVPATKGPKQILKIIPLDLVGAWYYGKTVEDCRTK